MDPITTAIITALSAGAVAGLTDTVKTAVTDSYNKLKEQLTKKHGANSDVVQAIEKLEARPESQGRKETLTEEIVAAKAEQDEEILATAKLIFTLVKPQQAGMGKFMIQNNGPVQGQNIGDHQQITQHFGEGPKA
jgi:pyrroline-5-carboxylate reductase